MMRYHRNTLRSRIGDGEALDAGDNEVYDTEHIPHLAKVPGVVSATRFKIEYSSCASSSRMIPRFAPPAPS
jgi:hypothetical protein